MALTPNFPGSYAITLYQHATFQLAFQYPTGTVLTSYTASMNVVDTSGNIIIRLTTANGDIAIDTTARTVTLNLTAAQTSLLPPGVYQYDLILINGALVNPVSTGPFTVTAGITAS